MGKLTYEQMENLLRSTLDIMDHYTNTIRRLLDFEGESDSLPLSEVIVAETVVEESVPVLFVENIDTVANDVESEIKEIDVHSNASESSDKLNQQTRIAATAWAQTYISDWIDKNDPHKMRKPPIHDIYSCYRKWCEESKMPACGRFAFEELLSEFYKPDVKKAHKPEPTVTVKRDNGFVLTCDNINSIKNTLRVGDVVAINHKEFGQIEFQVVGKNIDGADTITLISKDCVMMRKFDTDTQIYRESSIRKYLNEEFLHGLEIADCIIPVEKKTLSDSQHARLVKSEDYVWLPSRDELSLEEMIAKNLYENNRYPLFTHSSDRIKKFEGEPVAYLTRTALYDNGTKSFANVYGKGTYLYRVRPDGQIVLLWVYVSNIKED